MDTKIGKHCTNDQYYIQKKNNRKLVKLMKDSKAMKMTI